MFAAVIYDPIFFLSLQQILCLGNELNNPMDEFLMKSLYKDVHLDVHCVLQPNLMHYEPVLDS